MSADEVHPVHLAIQALTLWREPGSGAESAQAIHDLVSGPEGWGYQALTLSLLEVSNTLLLTLAERMGASTPEARHETVGRILQEWGLSTESGRPSDPPED
jgi:hypothetical protein